MAGRSGSTEDRGGAQGRDGSRAIRVDRDVYDLLVERAARIEAASGRRASASDAIRDLLRGHAGRDEDGRDRTAGEGREDESAG